MAGTDFKLNPAQLKLIRDILIEDPEVLRRWVEIKDEFLSKPSDVYDIERMLQCSDLIAIVVLKTLEKWASTGKDAGFNKCVQILQSKELLNIAEKLKSKFSTIKSLNQLQNVNLDREIWFEIPELNPFFSGRRKELQTLHMKVIRSELEKYPSRLSYITLISGLGGVGKSELARKYALKFVAHFDNNVVWIHGDTQETMERSFLRLGNQIGIENEANGIKKSLPEILYQIYESIMCKKCLFIFDSVESFDGENGLCSFLPPSTKAPGLIRPYVLVTTRKDDLMPHVQLLKLGVLSMEEAVECVQLATGIKPENIVEANKFCQLVRYLEMFPPALQQAAAYITRLKFGPSRLFGKSYVQQYLDEIQTMDENAGGKEINKFEQVVQMTWKTTLHKVRSEKHGRLATLMIKMLSYCNPDDFPISVFKSENWTSCRPLSKTEEDIRSSEIEIFEALRLLKVYSLINEEDGLASVNRILQRVIRVWVQEEGSEEYILETALRLAIQINSSSTYNILHQKAIPHIRSFYNYAIDYDSLLKLFGLLPERICVGLTHYGYTMQCVEFAKKAANRFEEVFGKTHELTLKIKDCYGNALNDTGRYSDAIAVFQDILQSCNVNLGPYSTLSARIKCNMAGSYRKTGMYIRALELYNESLDLYAYSKFSEGQHQSILHAQLQIINNRAGALTDLGRIEEAFASTKIAFEGFKLLYGPAHPNTISCEENIGYYLKYKGRYLEALEVFVQLIEHMKEMYTGKHERITNIFTTIIEVFLIVIQEDGKRMDLTKKLLRLLSIDEMDDLCRIDCVNLLHYSILKLTSSERTNLVELEEGIFYIVFKNLNGLIENSEIRLACENILALLMEDSPQNCWRFMESNGMQQWLGMIDFPSFPEKKLNLMILGNIAQFPSHQSALISDPKIIPRLGNFLEEDTDTVIRQLCCEILCYFQVEVGHWGIHEALKHSINDAIESQVPTWNLNIDQEVVFTNLTQLFLLIEASHSKVCRLYGTWTLANLMTTQDEEYYHMFTEENIQLLHRLKDVDYISEYVSVVLRKLDRLKINNSSNNGNGGQPPDVLLKRRKKWLSCFY